MVAGDRTSSVLESECGSSMPTKNRHQQMLIRTINVLARLHCSRKKMIEKEKENDTRTMAKGESLQAEPTWEGEGPLFLTGDMCGLAARCKCGREGESGQR